MSKQLIEQLAKEHFPGLKSQRKWISTNAPDKRGLAKGHEIDVFTIDATAEQLEAFAKSYQAAAPIVSELVAYRWKPKKNVIWIYNPDDSFIDTIKNDPDVDIEPLYTHAQPLEKPTSDNVPVDLDVLQFTEYGIVPDDYKNQASGYRAGWNDCLAGIKYLLPLEPIPTSDIANALHIDKFIQDNLFVVEHANGESDAVMTTDDVRELVRALIPQPNGEK